MAVPLYVSARGLTTSAIPHGARLFDIEFDFCDHQLRIRSSSGEERSDPGAAQRFWRQLLAAHRVLTEFRSRFIGKVSPVHFFWGSFDLAVTRFSGRTAPTHPARCWSSCRPPMKPPPSELAGIGSRWRTTPPAEPVPEREARREDGSV